MTTTREDRRRRDQRHRVPADARLNGQFEGLIEQFVRDRLTVQAAKKQGIRVTEEELQERADQFRRVRGLHRASDTNKYLDAMRRRPGRVRGLPHRRAVPGKDAGSRSAASEAVQTYFKLNSPKFDSIEVSHIVLDADGKAKEMISVLADDPDSFDEMAREHSIADTREQGGLIGKVLRGSLRDRHRGQGVQRSESASCSGRSRRQTGRCSRSSG